MPPLPRRPVPRAAPAAAALLLATLLAAASCTAETDAPQQPEAPAAAPAADPVERAADEAVRALLDGERLIEVVRSAGADRLSDAQRTALDAWLDEVRAMAPAPPPLRYRLDPDRFDAVSRTWPVDVALPTLGDALGAPATRLALVLEPLPGESATAARFHIVEARLALH